jgi:hypothetical protein
MELEVMPSMQEAARGSQRPEMLPMLCPVSMCDGETRSSSSKAPFQLQMESFNSSGLKQLKERLKTTESQVVLAQEVGIRKEHIGEFQAWCKARGWNAAVEPARAGVNNRGNSMGVAIIAKQPIGLRAQISGCCSGPTSRELHATSHHRYIRCLLDIPGWRRPIGVASVYFLVGEGLGAVNLALLQDMQRCLCSKYTTIDVVGGDFNNPAEAISESGFGRLSGFKVLKANDYTCMNSGNQPSCIDFFAATNDALALLETEEEDAEEGVVERPELVVDTGWPMRPHRPVLIRFKPHAQEVTKIIARPHLALPTTMPLGPMPPPAHWEAVNAQADCALQIAEEGSMAAAVEAMRIAYSEWANLAEEEIAAFTGTEASGRRLGRRGDYPRLLRVPIVHHAVERTAAQRLMTAWSLLDGWCAVRLCHIEADPQKPGPPFCEEAAAEIAISEDLEESVACARYFEGLAHDVPSSAGALRMLMDKVKVHCEAARQEVDSEGARAFDEYMENAADSRKGMSGLFRLGRDRPTLRTTTVPNGTRNDGGLEGAAVCPVTAELQKVVDHQALEYRKLWKADCKPRLAVDRGRKHHPRMTVQHIRGAAAKFKHATSTTLDGYHPRHLGMVSDAGVHALATLFMCMEAVGVPPPQLWFLTMPMLEKPSSGFRLILGQPAFMRVWDECKAKYMEEFCVRNDRSYFGMAKGKSCEMIVFAQAARTEEHIANRTDDDQLVVASVQLDGKKYYESFNLDLLMRRFTEAGGDEVCAKVLSNYWRSSRHLRADGFFSSHHSFTDQGLPAGTKWNRCMVMAYALSTFDRFAMEHPRCDFTSFIDDEFLGFLARRCNVVKEVKEAVLRFEELFEEDMQCKLAYTKITSTATCPVVAKAITSALGKLAGQAGTTCDAVPNLGIDLHMPGRRGKLPTKRRQRFAKAKRLRTRYGRIRRWLRRGKQRVCRLFHGQLKAATAYGAAVNGFDDGEISSLRSTLLSESPPRQQGVSLTLRLAVLGDPAWKEALAPARTWARLVWSSLTAPLLGMPTTGELMRMWNASAKRVNDETTWSNSLGPMARVQLCLRRIGWHCISFAQWEDQYGHVVNLGLSSPALIDQFMEQAMQRAMDYAAAAKLGKDQFQERVCTDQIRQMCKSKRFTPWEKYVAVAAPCRALRCRNDLIAMGYQVPAWCPLCEKEEDSLYHRAYECAHPDAVQARRGTPVELLDAARAEPQLLCWTTGHFAHPECHPHFEQPTQWGSIECTDLHGRQLQFDEHHFVHPMVFPDGSAYRHVVPELSRAAWAIVFANDNYEVEAILKGPVWARLGQTSQTAEHVACAIANQTVVVPCTAYTDCLSVVATCKLPCADQLRGNKLHAGIRKLAIQDENFANLASVRHVKAHLTREQMDALPFEEKMQAELNSIADAHARTLANSLRPDRGLLRDTEACMKTQRQILQLLARTMAVFPREQRAQRDEVDADQRAQKREQVRRMRYELEALKKQSDATHVMRMVPELRKQQCIKCLSLFEVPNANSMSPAVLPPCKPSRVLAAIRAIDVFVNHSYQAALVEHSRNLSAGDSHVARDGDVVVWCKKCGKFSTSMLRGLNMVECTNTQRGSYNLKALAKGMHPVYQDVKVGRPVTVDTLFSMKHTLSKASAVNCQMNDHGDSDSCASLSDSDDLEEQLAVLIECELQSELLVPRELTVAAAHDLAGD